MSSALQSQQASRGENSAEFRPDELIPKRQDATPLAAHRTRSLDADNAQPFFHGGDGVDDGIRRQSRLVGQAPDTHRRVQEDPRDIRRVAHGVGKMTRSSHAAAAMWRIAAGRAGRATTRAD
jgi:hypothetical protein